MSRIPHIKKIFPGANTYQGFHSNYMYMIESDAHQIYVIKGGPGVGKSTFMKKIAQDVLDAGFDVEFHCCSSDNNSIDGLVIPALKTALLDGTAPHIVDPKNPGAVDEIINLGEYWNKELIRRNKKEILSCNTQIGRHFKAAYFALKEAKNAMDEWEFYLEPYQDWTAVNNVYKKIENDVFLNDSKGRGKQRHLFAWAHTPQGRTQYIDSLLQGINSLYVLKGQPGTGKSSILTKISERAQTCGVDHEVYHSTLDPEKIDLLILPELASALLVVSEQYFYKPNFDGDIIEFDFDAYLDVEGLQPFVEDINSCRERISSSYGRTQMHIQRAKSLHDQLETYYIPAMNFVEIEKKRLDIVHEILN